MHVVDEDREGVRVEEEDGGSVGSLQPPNHPGSLQIDCEDEGREEVVVIVGAGAGDGVAAGLLVSVSSLQPNQPGVLHVDVNDVIVVVVTVGLVVVVVVDSSKQPNQPGVLQVSVLLLVALDVDVGTVYDVVLSEPLLSKYSHRKQSVQLTYCSHFAGSSYASSTSLITPTILWYPKLQKKISTSVREQRGAGNGGKGPEF